ncbi:AI-2E family transporter [Marinobacter sp. F4216]|uniref:AI-2E family transporter n=1 Tax=Marinobacter sp. F4216 TaxID=2874281 RepID=UPI001CC0D41B|nr:AI-2E family transporter [Marinobacter sp. F4216]MBZ2168102.1 AI-2E family transporter [Marinobacter sp. F4216]
MARSGQGPRAPQRSQAFLHNRLFNAVELRLFRCTAVLLSLVVLTALLGFVLWAFGWIVGAFDNLVLSLCLSGILALVLYPVVDFLERRCHFPHLLAVLSLMLVFFGGIGALVLILLPTLISQLVELMTLVPQTLAGWEEHFSIYFPELTSMVSDTMQSSEEESKKPVIEAPGETIMSYLGLLAGLSFVPLFLFFTLLSGDLLRGQANEILSIFREPTQQKVMYFSDVFLEYVTAFFQGQLLIALCMGILYALGFASIGLEYGVLVGLALGFLNIVPFLGSLIGLLVVLPIAYLQPDGGAELLVPAVIIFAVVQVIESWLLTPRIMANRSGLHPALVIISLFFWGTVLGGITGMVLAVPLTAFFVAIWREIKASLTHALGNEYHET